MPTSSPLTRRTLLQGGGALAAGAVLAGAGWSRMASAATTGPWSAGRGWSLAQVVGQRVIYSYPGTTPPADLLALIRAGEVGGVIFFGENITSEAQIASVIAQLAAAQQASPVPLPLLLMTDQEGGLVRRLPGAPVPSEKQIGESSDPPDQAAAAGTGAGDNLAGVGMDLNLAPVLDVFRQPGDFDDQFQRSYSSDPAVAAACGAAFTRAQQATGVAATGKHFPGLGAATAAQNTDEGPVTLDVPLAQLRSVDEVPFAAAIAAGIRLVMASWAVYPALDPTRPSGLSPRIIQGELRGRLGFRGVTITDAIEAGALTAFGSYGERGVLAAQAGMDLLLCSARDVSEGQAVAAAVSAALQGGTLDPWGFAQSLERVVALRAQVR